MRRSATIAVLALAGCGGGGEQVDFVLVEGSVYTLEWPAPLPQDEQARGTIARGSLANLTVVRPDPFRTAPELWIPEGRLLFTIQDGRVVQSAGAN